MILATLATKIQNLSNMFLALQKFNLKEDKLELEYNIEHLMMKRDLGFNLDDICRKREIIPGFHLYITKINSKHQTSFLLSLKVDLMLLLAIYSIGCKFFAGIFPFSFPFFI